MCIYLIIMTASVLCLYLSEHIIQKFWRRFFLALSILIPAAFAGIRGLMVGTDTIAYKIVYFEPMQEIDSFKNFLRYIQSGSYEIGFMGWCYIIAKVFNNFQIFLFLTELVILVFIYKTIYVVKHKTGIYFPLIVFYLLYYNNTFNIMRQMIACSITLYALSELIINKKYRYITFIFLSSVIHYTSIICLLIYALYFLVNRTRDGYKFKVVIMLSIVFVYFNLKEIGLLLQYLSFLPTRYIGFFKNHIFDDSFNISFIVFKAIPILMTLICTLILSKKSVLSDSSFQFGAILMVINIFSYFYYSGSAIERMLLYFEMFSTIIMVPLCIQKNSNGKESLFMKFSAASIFSLYWYWYYIFMGYAETALYVIFH